MSALQQQILADGPSLYWTMLQRDVLGTTMLDLSGNGFNGSIAGSPAYASSIFGNYMNFDGVDDIVSRPHDAALYAGTGQYSVECWIKSTVPTSNYAGVWSHDDPATGVGPFLYTNISTGAVRFWSASTTTPNVGTKRLTDGVLHHLICQREAGGVHATYVDNVQDTGTFITSSVAVATPTAWRLGSFDSVNSRYFGMIAHFAHYVGKSLDASARARHYQAGLRAGVGY